MKNYLLLALTIIFWACDSKKGPSKEDYKEDIEQLEAGVIEISDENIRNIINSIPSPLEISFLIHDAGIQYNKSILNSGKNVSRYNSNDKRALNLGVYGTDLGYTDIYSQSQDGIEYLSAIKELADDLGIGQYVDFETIRKLTETGDNLDSLLLVTSDNFNRINDHFQEQNRSALSVLLLLGGWIESLHLTCQVALQEMNNELIRERIGEQKIILENMMILLDVYTKDNHYFEELMIQMKELESAFKHVDIVYTYAESTSEVIDGVLVIKDNSTTEVKIADDDVTEIARIAEKIRNSITE
jgi:hypothetical protein